MSVKMIVASAAVLLTPCMAMAGGVTAAGAASGTLIDYSTYLITRNTGTNCVYTSGPAPLPAPVFGGPGQPGRGAVPCQIANGLGALLPGDGVSKPKLVGAQTFDTFSETRTFPAPAPATTVLGVASWAYTPNGAGLFNQYDVGTYGARTSITPVPAAPVLLSPYQAWARAYDPTSFTASTAAHFPSATR